MKSTNIMRMIIIVITMTIIGSDTHAMQRPTIATLADYYTLVNSCGSICVMSENSSKQRLERLKANVDQKIPLRLAELRRATQEAQNQPRPIVTTPFEVFRQEALEIFNQAIIAAFKKDTETLIKLAHNYERATTELSEDVILNEIFQTPPFLVIHFLKNVPLSQDDQRTLQNDQLTVFEAVLAKYQTTQSAATACAGPSQLTAGEIDRLRVLDQFALAIAQD